MWSDVETDFGLNETVNFGEREESGSSLYQLMTVATIGQRDPSLTRVPHVTSCSFGEFVCIAADRQLTMLSEGGRHLKSLIQYVTDVVEICCSEDHSLIAVAEQSGEVHLLQADTCTEVFSKRLETYDESQPESLTFKHLSFDHCQVTGSRLIAVTRSGMIHCIEGLGCIGALSEALLSQDSQTIKFLQSKISLISFNALSVHDVAVDAVHALRLSDDIVTCGRGQTNLCVWRKEFDGSGFKMKPYRFSVYPLIAYGDWNVVKVCSVGNESKLLVLDTRGCLSLWSLHTCTLLREWRDTKMITFNIIQEVSSSSNVSDVRLVTVMAADDATQSCDVKIIHFPSLSVEYSVRLSSFINLVPGAVVEELFIIEGKDLSDSGCPESLHLRNLVESDPETKLARLLQKRKFEEAETLCRSCGLDESVIIRAKIAFLLEQLGGLKQFSSEEREKLLVDLKSNLGKINDNKFVAECFLAVPVTSVDSAVEMLNLAKKRLLDSNLNERNAGLIKQCNDDLYKLGTFQMCFGCELYNAKTWQMFRDSRSSMFDQFVTCLRNGCITSASILWRRHKVEISSGLTSIETWLSVLPEDTSISDISILLTEDIIPYIVLHYPHLIVTIAGWLEARTRDLEITCSSDWPRNAYSLSCVLFDCLDELSAHVSTSNKEFYTPQDYADLVAGLAVVRSLMMSECEIDQQKSCQPDKDKISQSDESCNESPHPAQPFRSLYSLSQRLAELCNLHDNYKCRLTLAEYLRETVESVVYRMLDGVAVAELIPVYIQSTVLPYVEERKLEVNVVLHHYVNDLTERCSRFVSCVGIAPWESKAIQIIKCITGDDLKCLALLMLMSHAHIPYCDDLDSLISEALNKKNQQTDAIKEKLKLVEIQKLLSEYGLRHFNLSQRADIMFLIQRILYYNRSSSLSDALHVAKFYSIDEEEVFVFQACLIAKRDPSSVGRFFKDIAQNKLQIEDKQLIVNNGLWIALECAVRFTSIAKQTVDDIYQAESTRHMFAVALRETLKFLIQSTDENEYFRDVWMEELADVENIIALSVEFNLSCQFSDLSDVSARVGFVEKAKEILSEKEAEKTEIVELINENVHNDSTSDVISVSVLAEDSKNRKRCPKGKRTQHFAHLFRFTTEQTKIIQLKQTIEGNDNNEIKALLAELRSCVKESSEDSLLVFKEICDLVCRVDDCSTSSAEQRRDLLIVLRDVIKHIAMTIPVEYLTSCIQLAGTAELVGHVLSECGQCEQRLELNDLYTERYSEDGLILEFSSVLPALYSMMGNSAKIVSILNELYKPMDCRFTLAKMMSGSRQSKSYDIMTTERDFWASASKLSTLLENDLQLQLATAIGLHTLKSVYFCFSLLKCSNININDITNRNAVHSSSETINGNDKENVSPQHYVVDSSFTEEKSNLVGDKVGKTVHRNASESSPGINDDISRNKTEHTIDFCSKIMILPECSLNSKEQSEKLVSRNLSMLTKVFGSFPIDRCLALSYLTAIPHKRSALKGLLAAEKAAGSRYKRARSIAQVGLAYCKMEKVEASVMERVLTSLNSSDWGYRLAKLKISFHSVFSGPNSEKKQLIRVLAKTPALKTSEVVEYINSFNLNLFSCLLTCIESLLVFNSDQSMAEVRYQSADSSSDAVPIDVLLRRAEDFCRVFIKSFESDVKIIAELKALLDTVFKKLDPYDYERIGFVLSWLHYLKPNSVLQRNIELLHCLQSYKSISSSTNKASSRQVSYAESTSRQDEVFRKSHRRFRANNNFEKENVSDKTGRLPFHDILGEDCWKIISAELNLSSFEKCLHMSRILGLSSDDVIMTTFRNVVRDFIAEQKSALSKESIGHAKDAEKLAEEKTKLLLIEIDTLLCRLSSLEKAVQCATYAANEMTKDSDKMIALQYCVSLCKQWEQEERQTNGPKLERAREVSKKYVHWFNSISTKNSLIKYGLDDLHNLTLTGTPATLAFRVYEHESVEKRGRLMSGFTYYLRDSEEFKDLPDINLLVDEIASIHKIKVNNIRKELIQKWLPSVLKNRQEELDMTMTPDMFGDTRSKTDDESLDEKNLARVLYLLSHDPTEVSGLFELFSPSSVTSPNQSMNESMLDQSVIQKSSPSVSMSVYCMSRVIRTLLSLDHQHKQANMNDLRHMLTQCVYVERLMKGGASSISTVEEFVAMSKEAVVRSVWKNFRGSTFDQVSLLASLCLNFSISDSKLLQDVITKTCHMLHGEESISSSTLSSSNQSLRYLLYKMITRLWSTSEARYLISDIQLTQIIPTRAEESGMFKEDLKLICEMIYQWPAALHSSVLQQYIQLFSKQLGSPAYALSCCLLLSSTSQQKQLCTDILNHSADEVKAQLEAFEAGRVFFPQRDVISRIMSQHFSGQKIFEESVVQDQTVVTSPTNNRANDTVFDM